MGSKRKLCQEFARILKGEGSITPEGLLVGFLVLVKKVFLNSPPISPKQWMFVRMHF
jgi:hypothetical protein